MTGIERLRRVAEAQDMRNVWTAMLSHELSDIADQIEREQDGRVSRMRVLAVVTEMERHCLGHEGMDDSPVVRWARELREALGTTMSRHESDAVADSTSDSMTDEDREAAAWVREHGGLDYVRAEWRSRVPYDRYEARRQRLLDHIAECETALGRRRRRIEELGHRVNDLTTENAELRKRAMPQGYEWPRYEDGTTVCFGDEASRLGEVFEVSGICLYRDGSYALNFRAYSKDERAKRPEEVLAADGEPLEKGQTVWDTDTETDTPLTVVEVSIDLVRCEYTWKDGKTYRPCYPPDQLTHTKPEIDTWERIEEDKDLNPFDYCKKVGHKLWTFDNAEEFKASDLVRRCRALAERERGE